MPFSPFRLIQVVQGSALATIILNIVALWKQEGVRIPKLNEPRPEANFTQAWTSFVQGERAIRRLFAIGLGTMAFSMEDVLLEPYGGQILHLTVSSTTKLTATLAVGGLVGFWLASRVLSRGADPFRMAASGAMVGVPAFALVILAAPTHLPLFFGAGTLLIGFGAGLFGHGTLTATMNAAPADQAGLALGAWGAVQASGAGVAVALGGIIHDLVAHANDGQNTAAMAYDTVYGIEIILLFGALLTMAPLCLKRRVAPR